MIPFGV